MNFLINTTKLDKLDVTPNQYTIIRAIANNKIEQIMQVYKPDEVDIAVLVSRGYLLPPTSSSGIFAFEEENIKLCQKHIGTDLDFVEDWIKLFPEGIKSGGYYVRSSEKGVKKKFITFFNQYDFSPEEVLRATEKYIEEMRSKGWRGIQLAVNFIEKDGNSNLANYCTEMGKEPDSDADFSRNA